jgi:hypothetical protein
VQDICLFVHINQNIVVIEVIETLII